MFIKHDTYFKRESLIMIKIGILKSLDLKALSDKRIQQFKGNQPNAMQKKMLLIYMQCKEIKHANSLPHA